MRILNPAGRFRNFLNKSAARFKEDKIKISLVKTIRQRQMMNESAEVMIKCWNETWRCWKEMEEDSSWGKDAGSWRGKWRSAAVQLRLNERNKPDVISSSRGSMKNKPWWVLRQNAAHNTTALDVFPLSVAWNLLHLFGPKLWPLSATTNEQLQELPDGKTKGWYQCCRWKHDQQ